MRVNHGQRPPRLQPSTCPRRVFPEGSFLSSSLWVGSCRGLETVTSLPVFLGGQAADWLRLRVMGPGGQPALLPPPCGHG